MAPGDRVIMAHPDGYATILGAGDRFVGWVPNGVIGTVYMLTPDLNRAVVHFDGRLFATVDCSVLERRESVEAPAA